MAVNRIRYRDGRKICIPITKKSEYMALRDADFNRKCVEMARKGDKKAKTMLEQFNYSCYPNEDGTLKGTTKPADSVGMDIDLHVPEQLPEGVTQEKWIQDEILNISKNILDKKEEIGLLLCERSATKGLHIVFRRDVSLDQEGNLKRVSDVLGVPFDEAAKDITRVFFTPSTKDILFIDEEMFERRATPFPPFGHPFPVKGQGDRNNPSNNQASNSSSNQASNPSQANNGNFSPCPSTGKGCPKDGKGVVWEMVVCLPSTPPTPCRSPQHP